MSTEILQNAIMEYLNSGEYGRGVFNGGKPCKTTLYFPGGHVTETVDFDLYYVLYDDRENPVFLNPSNLGFYRDFNSKGK